MTNWSTVEGDPIFLKKTYFFNFTENGFGIFGCWGILVYVSICLPKSNVIAVALGCCGRPWLFCNNGQKHCCFSVGNQASKMKIKVKRNMSKNINSALTSSSCHNLRNMSERVWAQVELWVDPKTRCELAGIYGVGNQINLLK